MTVTGNKAYILFLLNNKPLSTRTDPLSVNINSSSNDTVLSFANDFLCAKCGNPSLDLERTRQPDRSYIMMCLKCRKELFPWLTS